MALTEQQVVSVLLRQRTAILARIDTIVRDAHKAEDVLQEVSMAALDKRDTIVDLDHLPRWLSKVAREKAIDLVRRESARPLVFSDDVLDLMENEWAETDRADAAAMQDALRSCLEGLSPYARRRIESRYREDLTGPQLAEQMGRSINTVKVALTRAHRALLECMRTQMGEEV